ncbi:hypothetical protein CROQUDRAFT_91178 [Cronartium quercuum f. sp. fusiforme G11]|uniref:Uncharacterized protein n=1 Tax=Cronartium quercuum f. sp. fusiforme G11 TaxID=708437 RepID=A0A9P6NIM6_9BASI|nr:hypothetical protein CROQUDRAFT_91178 [Cronartium quercuum f. sp. fusiforme G11]
MKLLLVHLNRFQNFSFQLSHRFISTSSKKPINPIHHQKSKLTTSTPPNNLRSIIELYHSAQHFAPVNDHDRLIEFIDDSLLFKKSPAPYPPPSSPSILPATIRALPLNQPILRPGETEFDLNPLIVPHRVRAGQRRWEMLKDALCGTAGSPSASDISHQIGILGSGFGTSVNLDHNHSESSAKAGLEIVQENWKQIKEIERQT